MKNSETRRNDPHRTNDVLTATATDPKLLLVLPLQLLLSVAIPLIVPLLLQILLVLLMWVDAASAGALTVWVDTATDAVATDAVVLVMQ